MRKCSQNVKTYIIVVYAKLPKYDDNYRNTQDSYRNMLHYIDIPFEKNIQLSVDKLSELDQRRGIDSKTIFKDFYKDINHGKTI